jgi:hypothetical protein
MKRQREYVDLTVPGRSQRPNDDHPILVDDNDDECIIELPSKGEAEFELRFNASQMNKDGQEKRVRDKWDDELRDSPLSHAIHAGDTAVLTSPAVAAVNNVWFKQWAGQIEGTAEDANPRFVRDGKVDFDSDDFYSIEAILDHRLDFGGFRVRWEGWGRSWDWERELQDLTRRSLRILNDYLLRFGRYVCANTGLLMKRDSNNNRGGWIPSWPEPEVSSLKKGMAIWAKWKHDRDPGYYKGIILDITADGVTCSVKYLDENTDEAVPIASMRMVEPICSRSNHSTMQQWLHHWMHDDVCVCEWLSLIKIDADNRHNTRHYPSQKQMGLSLGCVGYAGKTMMSAHTRILPNTTRLLVAWGLKHLPEGFDFTSITLNRNYEAALHVDKNNVGPSSIVGLGNYSGGELWVNGSGALDVKRKWRTFDGCSFHATLPFTGTRYTVIYFTARSWPGINGVDRSSMESLGFHFPHKPPEPTSRSSASSKAKAAAKEAFRVYQQRQSYAQAYGGATEESEETLEGTCSEARSIMPLAPAVCITPPSEGSHDANRSRSGTRRRRRLAVGLRPFEKGDQVQVTRKGIGHMHTNQQLFYAKVDYYDRKQQRCNLFVYRCWAEAVAGVVKPEYMSSITASEVALGWDTGPATNRRGS